MRIAILLVLGAACRHAAVTAPITDTDDDDIPDVEDRCPDVPGDCILGEDDDGCPDPGPLVVHLPLGAEDRARLAEVARLRPAPDVIVVGHALPNEVPGLALERATAIALRLEELGLPLQHLLARATGPRAPDDTSVVEVRCVAPTGPSASR